ncbi:hypothetical protein [Pseudomonas sp. EA_65y_Pfl1_P113]|uniref:hypothetical protein n=1 Tax=Pseudomonas sp. EA_65y_Pfl1_P113 TaxID=3088692 RepID=UPI0030DD8B1A
MRWYFGLSEEDASRLKEFVTEENQNDMGLLYNSLPAWEKAALIGKEVLTASGASIGRDKTSIASIVGKGKGGAGVQGGGTKESAPSKTAVQELEVDAYKNLKAREVVGDGLEHDHIPSFAALRTAKEAELGRPLTELETKTLLL